MEDHNNTEAQKENTQYSTKHLKLRELWIGLPSVLQRLVIERLAGALLCVVLMIAMVALSGDWGYSVIALIGLLLAYMGFDILWKYAEGKIFAARMVVCKANRRFLKKGLKLTMRPAIVENVRTEEFETYEFTVSPAMRDAGDITAGTVMEIYITEDAPTNILAYMIMGEDR